LFIGNPGTGKTTVATLLAKALAELEYRKNPTPVLTSADEILSSGMPPPAAAFAQMAATADGGTLFIDEAYLFNPAPKGSTANDSNKVLNTLMKLSETMRLTTSFILAGYKEEMTSLLGYNPGFPSRFPKKFTFDFVDYTEIQLTKILHEMTVARGFHFESMRQCGVPIARVLARRLSRGANKKGFGNARECERLLDLCVQNQSARLVKLKTNQIPITPDMYRTLTRADTVGERPRLEDSSYMAQLMSMIGLKQVKDTVKNLMNLQLQNYDAEMRGEQIQVISLHRLFLGNPGTGKTTVARIYGKMLQQFGFLSDGDLIEVTPSDLKGHHQGDAATRTREVCESAKGKVLFIDEAYNLDPARANNTYGNEVIDTLVECVAGNAGVDMCVIMAGYKPQMEEMFRNCNNPGLKGRFNIGEALMFEDFTDEDIKKVLKQQVVEAGLIAEPGTLDYAISVITKKRMEDGFRNAGEAGQILDRAKLRHSTRLTKNDPPVTHPKRLIPSDFAGEELTLEQARDAFNGLDNLEHVYAVLDKFEALVETAKESGKKPHEVMADSHMLFLGPPGTGKTTLGQRFAQMFKHLEILPSDRFEYTTAGNLLGRYMGSTSNNTLDALRKAKGGILFIDEAYGMLPRHGSYGGEIIQTLIDNVTSEEFKGKVIVILAGYEDHITQLFEINAGFQSRFDKMRVQFDAWTAEQATRALVNLIVRDHKTITPEAEAALGSYFQTYADLPNWASARDVKDIILQQMEGFRAERSFELSKQRRLLAGAGAAAAGGGVGGPKPIGPRGSAQRDALPPQIPYELVDVQKTFASAIAARGGDANGGGPQSSVRKIYNKVSYKELLKRAERGGTIVVVNFASVATCPHSARFTPIFEDIAEENNDVMFAAVDSGSAEDVFSLERVSSVPCTLLFLKGIRQAEVKGVDANGLRSAIMSLKRQLTKLGMNAPPPPPLVTSGQPGLPPRGPNIAYGGTQTMAKVEKPPVISIRPGDDTGDDDNDDGPGNESNFWAALEDACAELGWSLDKVKMMLEDEAKFPPPEIMAIIQRKTGAKNPLKVKSMLQQQRGAVLEKIKISIKAAEKAKSEEEAKIQTKLKMLGRCPMGFEWLREGSGWRCAGGSHYCTDQELSEFKNDV
jgi:SpoVK/Ycf46/Vps4 family AAA+-type ATPase